MVQLGALTEQGRRSRRGWFRDRLWIRSNPSALVRPAPPGPGWRGGTGRRRVPQAQAMLEDLRRHDPLTRAHAERVRGLAEVIGASLGLTAPDREKLRVASLLHDIGKLAVPRHILNKPDEPTDAEWRSCAADPEAAEGLLAPIRPWLGEWVGAATEHHERFDGGGYPRGLAREEITLAGRIVAVADAYDCIVSSRSYKAAVPAEQAAGRVGRQQWCPVRPRDRPRPPRGGDPPAPPVTVADLGALHDLLCSRGRPGGEHEGLVDGERLALAVHAELQRRSRPPGRSAPRRG